MYVIIIKQGGRGKGAGVGGGGWWEWGGGKRDKYAEVSSFRVCSMDVAKTARENVTQPTAAVAAAAASLDATRFPRLPNGN